VPYSKSEHRQRVKPLLTDRSDKAVEFKWCNVNAVLEEAGLPWIDGYKPLQNYQERLRELTAVWLMDHSYLRVLIGVD
jgi:hypothetical protein